MLSHLDPASSLAIGLLIFALVMLILFEATNGFHDAANAVATVIYTKSLPPGEAVVLSPPDGGPAVAMLVSLFVAALSWNIGTWWFALPNSSSHCLIGALIGVAVGNSFVRSRNISDGVHCRRPMP